MSGRKFFPCLYNCSVSSWQLYRQTATAVYSRQSSYTERETSSHLMKTGGAHASLVIKISPQSYPKNLVLLKGHSNEIFELQFFSLF